MKKNVIMCAGIAGIVFLAGCGSSPRAQEVTEVGRHGSILRVMVS